MRIFLTFILIGSFFISQGQPLPNTDSKNKKAKAAFSEGLKQYGLMELDQACALLNKALKFDPNYLDALWLLARVNKEQGKVQTSLENYTRMLEINPQFAQVYFEKGDLLFEMGKYEESKEHLQGYLSFNPTDKTRVGKARKLLENCEFAAKAIKNPVPFNPVNLGPGVNSSRDEYWPGLTIDEQTMFYTRLEMNGRPNEEFFVSKMGAESWGPSYNIGPPINTELNEGAVTVSADGNYLFFAANRPEGKGRMDLYMAYLKGDKWSKPINLESPVNTADWESQPSLSSDGKTIYFASNRPGGYGGIDLWKTTFENNRLTEPVNLGPNINTPEDDESPFIHADNQTLYFTSRGWPGMGNSDIYYSKKDANGNWQPPVNLGYPINTSGEERSLIVNRSGKKAFFASSGLKGYGGLDIFSFDLHDGAKPEIVSFVKGTVYDSETKQKLPANIELVDLATGKVVNEVKTNEKTGVFLVALPANANYAFNVNSEGYLFYSDNFSLKNNPSNNPFLLDVPLNKVKIGEKVVLRNVFFDTDSYNLKDESKTELNKLISLLKKYPKLKIELGGHTDNKGGKQHNQLLSQNRAKAVYDFLVKNEIDKNRLTFKGYGESQPVSTNETEEGRALNRRTEFMILEN